jgi:hypothetical protein
MQMRSCAKWFCLSMIGVFALTGSASAAPKKKHKKDKTEQAAPAEEPEVAPEPVQDTSPKDVDSLMENSTKKKSSSKPKATEPDEKAEPEGEVGEPDAWERPPLEAEKPKKKKHLEKPEEKKGDGRNKNIGLLAGWGFAPSSGFGGGINPYQLGAGLQGDYELDNHLVLGVGGEFFYGGTETMARNTNGAAVPDTYARYILAHVLVGYNVWFGTNLILRPSLWVGTAIGLQPPDAAGVARNVWAFLIAPGLTLHYLVGDNGWYLGADVRFSIPLAQANSARTGLPIMLTFGKRF